VFIDGLRIDKEPEKCEKSLKYFNWCVYEFKREELIVYMSKSSIVCLICLVNYHGDVEKVFPCYKFLEFIELMEEDEDVEMPL
jgi:hypothetical protein